MQQRNTVQFVLLLLQVSIQINSIESHELQILGMILMLKFIA